MQKRDVDTSLMQHAGIELGPHRYDARYKPLRYATLTCHKPRIVHTLHNTRARGRSRRGTLSKMASFIAEIRDFHSRRGMGARTIAWGRCTPLTIVDQFGIKISDFTPSFEALGRLLKKKEYDDGNSYERFLV